MNMMAVIHNERIKGFAGAADSIAVAFAVAAGAKFYQAPWDTLDLFLGLYGVALFASEGYFLREMLRPEN